MPGSARSASESARRHVQNAHARTARNEWDDPPCESLKMFGICMRESDCLERGRVQANWKRVCSPLKKSLCRRGIVAEDKAHDRLESLDSGRERNAVIRSQWPDAARMDVINGLSG